MISPGRVIDDRELWLMATTPGHNGETPLEYFERNIAVRGDFNCWVWQGRINKYGYGRMKVPPNDWFTHRFAYEIHRGSAFGLQLDHLCRNRPCCNPWHLEPVSPQVNKARAYGFGLQHRRIDARPIPKAPRPHTTCAHNLRPSKCRDCRKAAKAARDAGRKKYWERVRSERLAERAGDVAVPVGIGGSDVVRDPSSEGQVRDSGN